MNAVEPKTKPFLRFIPYVVLLALGSFYLYHYTGYLFFYQEKALLFQLDFTYLSEHLRQPGGFLKYLSNLQTTFYYYPLAGAVINTFEVCAAIFLLAQIAKELSGRRLHFLPFALGAALYYLQIHFQYQASNTLGILLALVLFYLALRVGSRKASVVFVVLFPLLHFLLGVYALLFLLLLTVFYIQNKNGYKLLFVWVWGAACFVAGTEMLYMQTPEILLMYPFSVAAIGGQVQLFVAVLALLCLYPLLVRLPGKKRLPAALKKLRMAAFSPLLVLLLLAVAVVPRIDDDARNYFQVEKMFYEQKYDDVIAFNKRVPSNNMLTSFLNNVALAEKGLLSDALFQFRQSRDGRTLLLPWDSSVEILQHGRYFFYAIGLINEAQRWSYESVMLEGYSPEGLKMLIKTDLIKGKYKVAEKYMAMLEKSLFYRKEAAHFRNFLFNDEAVAQDQELGRKKRLDTRRDFFVHANAPEANIDEMLSADSTNIPLIEYKLATLLLKNDMKGVVSMLPLMEKAGYRRIPTNVEELVVAYKLSGMGELPPLEHLKINPETEQRFNQFFTVFQQYGRNKKRAQAALAARFVDTYWYFMFYS